MTVLSPDGKLLAVAGPHHVRSQPLPHVSNANQPRTQLHLLSYPSLVPVAETIETDKEIYDAAFSSDSVRALTIVSILKD